MKMLLRSMGSEGGGGKIRAWPRVGEQAYTIFVGKIYQTYIVMILYAGSLDRSQPRTQQGANNLLGGGIYYYILL